MDFLRILVWLFLRILDMYQSTCNTKVIHNAIVDKRGFNLLLMIGIHAIIRKNTRIGHVQARFK